MAYSSLFLDGYFFLWKVVTLLTKVFLLVLLIAFDLSGKGDPSDNYAIAGITLRFI